MLDEQEIKQQKQALRREYLARRRDMSQQAAAEGSRQICRCLQEFLTRQLEPAAGAVFSYLAYGREVNLAELHQKLWGLGWPLAAPRTIGLPAGEMQPVYFQANTRLEKSALGIWEPEAAAEHCRTEDIGVVLLPGVAFDERGGRLGHGGGYYDRFLAVLPPEVLLIGVGYAWQVLPQVPREPWDKPLDWLVTEKGIQKF